MEVFKKLITLLISITLVAGCVASKNLDRATTNSDQTTEESNPSNPGGNPSTNPGDSDIDNDKTDPEDVVENAVELRFFIDPKDGSAQTKLSLPKNFEGYLYITGNNLASLQGTFVDVNFKFGVHNAVITVPATISKAKNGGIVPQTDTNVLVLNFEPQMFKNLGLIYDLYDYNNYEADEPYTYDPENIGLYCRGLNLIDDPTYAKNALYPCENEGDKCLYAYAKIVDSGLYQDINGTWTPFTPRDGLIDGLKKGFNKRTFEESLLSALPDSGSDAELNALFNGDFNFTYGTMIGDYMYKGPYSPTSTHSWQIKGKAITGPYGIYREKLAGDNVPPHYGTKSNLFPRAFKRELQAGVEYFGSTDRDGTRVVTHLSSPGETAWMDGVSARVLSRQSSNGESISSCNVTGSIELINHETKQVITRAKNLKLQVVRARSEDYRGEENIISSFYNCNSSSECGSKECCYNGRCWSKSIVYQCADQASTTIGKADGESCRSDLECLSLCCPSDTKKCKSHNAFYSTGLFCGKDVGQTCIANEWCKQEDVNVCKVYIRKYEMNAEGVKKPVCGVVCLPEKRFGSCINGVCQAPVNPPAESLSEIDCSTAPELLE